MNVRIKYAITEKGKFISHLEVLRTWERSIRRAKIPLAYSQGFNPHPKLSFASALAVGVTSEDEYVDVELKNSISIEEINKSLEKSLPSAINIIDVKEIDKKSPSLMSIINRAKYNIRVRLLDPLNQADFEQKIDDLFKQEQIIIRRKGKKGMKEKDIKSGIYNISGRIIDNKFLDFNIDVQSGSEDNIRPGDVLNALIEVGISLDMDTLLVHRKGLYISNEKGLISPLDV
ncbi:radical SAM-linked protein [Desulfonispora thiosulfatigenes DSM 11270]|uniref:Radical SAM-linked protein n=1 Tax=Desulfonispora thiosulfatigenes DSM 11270 TaxID=656914 RepID=A0A1W1UH32_DESTI|nr:TIGR03936 family radical SAM-associated protein [Desulfonispora thiosulfatigenes]SMB80406.1 radical SAM-linked protein [Desulfonispora thiosulfatigenes DSM 11270]